jgi:hypothetical protein
VATVRPGTYKIVVEGELGPRYATAFASMRLEARDGDTELVGRLEDQAELQGLLDSVAALGLALISVTPIGDASG